MKDLKTVVTEDFFKNTHSGNSDYNDKVVMLRDLRTKLRLDNKYTYQEYPKKSKIEEKFLETGNYKIIKMHSLDQEFAQDYLYEINKQSKKIFGYGFFDKDFSLRNNIKTQIHLTINENWRRVFYDVVFKTK